MLKKNSHLLTLIIVLCTFASCVKKIDGPLQISNIDFQEIEIPLKSDYSTKAYFNLVTQQIIKYSPTRQWNVAFNNTNKSEKVILNYEFGFTCFGQTFKTTDFSKVVSETELSSATIQYANHYDDFATLFSDNFENGINKGYVYYLNFDEFGYKKFKILEFIPGESVTFEYANLNNTNKHSAKVILNSNTNFTYYSFVTHNIVDVEPLDKNSWDLEFTRYTTLVDQFNSVQMYSVAGVLNNISKNINIAEIENSSIQDIDIKGTANQNYESDIQAIGYDWKIFSSASFDGVYSIPNDVYIINNEGEYYSMQFTNFSKIIENSNSNGYPKFLLNPLN